MNDIYKHFDMQISYFSNFGTGMLFFDVEDRGLYKEDFIAEYPWKRRYYSFIRKKGEHDGYL